jgi:hypothetical protein
MQRRWYQEHAEHPHYDLTSARMRGKAVKAGAVLMTTRQLSHMMIGWKRGDYVACPMCGGFSLFMDADLREYHCVVANCRHIFWLDKEQSALPGMSIRSVDYYEERREE